MTETGNTGLLKPGVGTAVRHFETVYDLRQATTGEFVARPSAPPACRWSSSASTAWNS
jgi:hypothetical protein